MCVTELNCLHCGSVCSRDVKCSCCSVCQRALRIEKYALARQEENELVRWHIDYDDQVVTFGIPFHVDPLSYPDMMEGLEVQIHRYPQPIGI